jgi:glutamate dehydrogenase
MIVQLYKNYPQTAKLIALKDISGSIYDPQGLHFPELMQLFEQGLPIRYYDRKLLSIGGIFSEHDDQLLHRVKADIFIPCGGRPATLNKQNIDTYLDAQGRPTSYAIIEGANLYLTPDARNLLEQRSVLVLQDSSCNKGGVICSSMEVLAGLCLTEEEFLQEKDLFVKEVLNIIEKTSLCEARLLLETHKQTGMLLTEISHQISEKILQYKDQLLEDLTPITLSDNPKDLLNQILLNYCPPLLQTKYQDRVLAMPDPHKKAIIACKIASHFVYTQGIHPSLNTRKRLYG